MASVVVKGKITGKEQTISAEAYDSLAARGLTRNFTVLRRMAGKPAELTKAEAEKSESTKSESTGSKTTKADSKASKGK